MSTELPPADHSQCQAASHTRGDASMSKKAGHVGGWHAAQTALHVRKWRNVHQGWKQKKKKKLVKICTTMLTFKGCLHPPKFFPSSTKACLCQYMKNMFRFFLVLHTTFPNHFWCWSYSLMKNLWINSKAYNKNIQFSLSVEVFPHTIIAIWWNYPYGSISPGREFWPNSVCILSVKTVLLSP